MSEGFMIGRVSGVGDDYSWIELITSSTFLLAAVVVDTWDLGVINGDDMGNIWLMYMPPDKEFKRGMLVSTALVGDYLPPGIPVGMIWGPGEIRDGLMPHRVASGAHLTQLYSVQILSSGVTGTSP
jgi:rod shape-determining protein MreC